MHIESENIDLEQLVAHGQRQGYLTYAQINDHLPRGIADVEAMEDVLRLLDKTNVTILEEEPSAEEVIERAEAMKKAPQGAKRGAGGEALEDEPEANTDVVAHYFRDMGEIKLLEPHDEVSLARGIEQNQRQITQALALCPAAVSHLLARLNSGERIENLVSTTSEDEVEDARARLEHIGAMVDDYRRNTAGDARAASLDSLRHALVSEMGELRLSTRTLDELVSIVRGFIERIRTAENTLSRICVDRARMQRRKFIELVVDRELDPGLVDLLINEGQANGDVIEATRAEIVEAQGEIGKVTRDAGLNVASLKALGRSISTADASAKRAKEAMVNANLRLVVSLAKGFNNRGVAFSDLVQEGNIGLMKAVEQFDYRKKGSFASQASWWIRRAINQSMGDQGHAIHVPAAMAEQVHKLNRLTRMMSHELGRDPTPEELAGPMKLRADKIQQLMRHAREPLSLETPIGDEEGPYSLGDHLADQNAEGAARAADRSDLQTATRELLDTLSAKEAAALKLHFGLGTDNNLSYEQLSEQLDMPRDKIRQLGVRALKKLRGAENSQALRALLDAVSD